jgi:hypothetical protein
MSIYPMGLHEYLLYDITESFLVICFLKVPSGSLPTIRWYVIFTKLASTMLLNRRFISMMHNHCLPTPPTLKQNF